MTGRFLLLALALCALAACSHPPMSPAPAAPPPPAAVAAPAPAVAPAPEPAPPPFDPLVLLPTNADTAISYTGRTLKGTWPWHLVRAAVDDQSSGSASGSVCGMVPLLAFDQLDVDLRGPGETPNADFVAVVQTPPELDPRLITGCVERMSGGGQRFQISNGVMTFVPSPDRSPIVFAYTDPTRFIAAASAAGSFEAFVDALHRGLPLRGAPALADLIGQVAPHSAVWVALAGGAKPSDAQAALGIRPVSLVASATLAGALTVTARLRLDSADAARKVAVLVLAQLGKLGGRFDELEVSAAEADVTLRSVTTQAQTEVLAAALGVHLTP